MPSSISNAAAPVGATNPTVTVNNLGVAYKNAEATSGGVMATAITAAATGAARSVGLASHNNTTGAAQEATVAEGAILSLYAVAATTVAISATGGTISATGAANTNIAGTGWTSSSTGVAFIFNNTASGTASTVAVLYQAPTTAGTYTISACARNSTTVMGSNPSTTDYLLGTCFGVITLTVGGSHPAVGGTNAPDTLGVVNNSLFVAVATNNGATGVIHPTTTLGTGEGSALSKGLLVKDTSFKTAQTATVLAGGVLSLYSNVSTTTAITASGGSFSGSQGSTGVTATYSSNLRTTLFTGPTVDTRDTIATLWTAPSTPGTYSLAMYVDDGAGNTPTESIPAVSLGAAITVTVVAASAGGSYSAAYSVCNTAPAAAAITAGVAPAGIDTTTIFENGTSAYINFDLNDAYVGNLDPGNVVATATNGGIVNIGAGTGVTAGTASTDVDFIDGAGDSVRISQPTAGAPLTTTVTITYNGTTVCTKTITIRGAVAKLTVENIGTQKTGNSTASDTSQWMYQQTGAWLTNGSLFTVVATDSAGNVVSTPTALGSYSADAATLTTTVQAIAVNTPSTTATASSTGRFNYGSWACGNDAGQASVKIKFTTAATGVTVSSDAFTARCAGNRYSYTASLDKAAYTIGEIATATVKFLDSKGNAANSVTAPGASSFVLPFMTGVDFTLPSASDTAVTKADGSVSYRFTVGTSTGATAGTYTGIIEYTSATIVSAKSTPTYKISTGTNDVEFTEVLKSVVALIASINKQIRALQKLILRR